MKLKQLESYMEKVNEFEQPKLHLEQYVTSAHIGSHMVYTMDQTYDDVQGKFVADFGCGCAVLSIGCGMLGAPQIIALDVDPDALDIASENVTDFELEEVVSMVNCDVVNDERFVRYLEQRKMVDTVVMNPPFGTKNNKGCDMRFLQHAVSVAQNAVYSLHKTSTRDYVVKKAEEWGCSVEVIAELRYDLPRTYKFHKKQSLDVHVDFIRVEPQR